VDECVRGVGANAEPRYHCFGGFRHWRITLRSLGACVPKRFGAHGRRRVFLWRYHGLSPWGSIEKEIEAFTRGYEEVGRKICRFIGRQVPLSFALEGGVKGHNIKGEYLTGKLRPLGRGASLC